MHQPRIVIPLGDPAGIGPEIVAKALTDPRIQSSVRCLLVGSRLIFEQAINLTGADYTLPPFDPVLWASGAQHWAFYDLADVDMQAFHPGEVSALCGQAAYHAISTAIDLAMNHAADAVVTPPIHKEALRAAGVPYIGHTEIFGALTGTPDPLTMFEVDGLRVFFLSRHVSLQKACQMVKKERIKSYVRRIHQVLCTFGEKDGLIAIAALNPHCGEHGLFGQEEMEEILPAVSALQKEGLPVTGPISADAVFHQAKTGRYAAVLSLYHDQGHIATKTLDFYRTISVTCGMPILRTSVDHGTAMDIAWKNCASPVSMIEAILLAAKYGPSFEGRII